MAEVARQPDPDEVFADMARRQEFAALLDGTSAAEPVEGGAGAAGSGVLVAAVAMGGRTFDGPASEFNFRDTGEVLAVPFSAKYLLHLSALTYMLREGDPVVASASARVCISADPINVEVFPPGEIGFKIERSGLAVGATVGDRASIAGQFLYDLTAGDVLRVVARATTHEDGDVLDEAAIFDAHLSLFAVDYDVDLD